MQDQHKLRQVWRLLIRDEEVKAKHLLVRFSKQSTLAASWLKQLETPKQSSIVTKVFWQLDSLLGIFWGTLGQLIYAFWDWITWRKALALSGLAIISYVVYFLASNPEILTALIEGFCALVALVVFFIFVGASSAGSNTSTNPVSVHFYNAGVWRGEKKSGDPDAWAKYEDKKREKGQVWRTGREQQSPDATFAIERSQGYVYRGSSTWLGAAAYFELNGSEGQVWSGSKASGQASLTFEIGGSYRIWQHGWMGKSQVGVYDGDAKAAAAIIAYLWILN
jgi:hypothetical protein